MIRKLITSMYNLLNKNSFIVTDFYEGTGVTILNTLTLHFPISNKMISLKIYSSILSAITMISKFCFLGYDDFMDPLVSGPRGVQDNQLTASSMYPNNRMLHDPKYGRLFFYKPCCPEAAAWSARHNNVHQYIQVSFFCLLNIIITSIVIIITETFNCKTS